MSSPKLDVIRLIKKLLLCFFLLLLYLIPGIIILYLSGELVSLDWVIHRQQDTHKVVMWGPAYTDPIEYYRLHSIAIRKPDIIVMGTSRVMEFRSAFFAPGANFYNSGRVIEASDWYKEFLRAIPSGQEPKVIIVAIEPKFMRASVQPSWRTIKYFKHPNELFDMDIAKVWNDFFLGKYSWTSLRGKYNDNVERYGMFALAAKCGYINDGSYYYGDLPDSKDSVNSWISTYPIDMKRNRDPYSQDNELSMKAIEDVREFLEDCHRRNIYVVGYLPPFAPSVYKSIIAMGQSYGYLNKLGPAMETLFHKYGFKFFDFLDITKLGSTDEESLDGHHPSQKADLRMLIAMAEQDPNLRKWVNNLDVLKARLAASKSCTYVFKLNEF